MVVEDTVGGLVSSAGGCFLSVGEFVEFNIFSYTDISSNAEMSDSLGINSLFSVGFIACAAFG